MGRCDNHSIAYPTGCRPVTEDLGPDELIRRLKTLAHTLQSMGQDDGDYKRYIPLAMHIADDFFLSYSSSDVQLLVACCIADILRVYAPEAPYKDPSQVKTIFLFLISQLGGLKDPKDPAFKRYFYLLENLAYVKSFNMCFELEDSQEIFCKLFKLVFNLVNDEHSDKVKSFMLDVLIPLINESDVVSNELLNIVLSHVLEPAKTQRRNAYKLATELIQRCSDTLEQHIHAFFNHVLIMGREDKTLSISQKVYDLIYELNHISSSILIAVLPQLEFKLKSTDEEERFASVSLLARMFSEKDSQLALEHKQLWTAFLGRFNDISMKIRIKCVQYSMHFLLNHPELREDITHTLKLRQHDAEETVRYEVVMAIVTTAKRDLEIVASSEDLLTFVKERTLDKKFKIRKEAMCGLAMIYKRHLSSNTEVPLATQHALTWIKDKILHGYYMTSIDDRLLVERLLNTCLVPYQLPAEERMRRLLQLFATIDENAGKAFVELQKHQLAVRKGVADLVELQRSQVKSGAQTTSEERESELNSRVGLLAKFLPDPLKVQEYLRKLATQLCTDATLMSLMERVVAPDASCKESVEAVTQVLKRLGQPVMTNLYYNTVKMLLERTSNVMVDGEALRVLLKLVAQAVAGHADENDCLSLPSDIAAEKGLKLLYVLSFVSPAHFLHEDLIQRLLELLKDPVAVAASPPLLSILTYIGKCKPIGDIFPNLASELVPVCKRFAESGSVKQAKQAIRCISTNLPFQAPDIFSEILDKIKEQLSFESKHFRTSIVTLGHIAIALPEKFAITIKNIVSRKIVKELLMRNHTAEHTPNSNSSSYLDEDSVLWTDEDEWCEETRVKVEGVKMMARWLLGLKSDMISAQKTFRMLTAFIMHKGDLLQTNSMVKAEMSALRLCAGSAMLKICEQKGVGDQFTAEQFYNLSLLMTDECSQVRERFALKVHKGLSHGVPNKCLPLDFMGFYALAGADPDRELKAAAKQYMVADINKRHEYVKSITFSSGGDKALSQLPHIMPDYMLVFAVPLLAHLPDFTDPTDTSQLTRLRQCLWFILEPLMAKKDSYCFGFYKALIESTKNHTDAIRPQDETANTKLWAVCDLAMGLIISKTTSFEMKLFPPEPRIPPMYFKKHSDPYFINVKSYLPTEMQVFAPKGSTKPLSGIISKKSTTSATLKKTGSGPSIANASSISISSRLPQLEEDDADVNGKSASSVSKRRRTDDSESVDESVVNSGANKKIKVASAALANNSDNSMAGTSAKINITSNNNVSKALR